MTVYGWICTILYYSGLELVTFILVDAIVKSPLRDAANDVEKRTIWLYESVGLAVICILLYLLHHMPYILTLLTCVTFVYTQVVSRRDVTQILVDLRAHWDNHLQHEESMKQIERQKSLQQQQQQTLAMTGLPVADASGQNVEQGYAMNFPFLNKQPVLQYPPNATVVPGQDTPSYSLNSSRGSYRQGPSLYTNYSRNWNNAPMTNHSNINTPQVVSAVTGGPSDGGVTSLQNVSSNIHRLPWSQQNLPRRSLHPNVRTNMPVQSLSPPTIKSRVMNVIGLSSSTPRPVGLGNYGQNLCFINSVVQCLARGPYIVDSLTAIAAKDLECSVFESQLLSSLAELLDNLTLPPDESHQRVSSVSKFRQACSQLNSKLVTPHGEHMKQQDAAEFLMWLLATLHGILNKNRRALQLDTESDDGFSSARLTGLKQIYGDLTAKRVQELKDQCRKDIAAAKCLENESYTEAIQRLSDLEWLIYKQANDTLIDNLFTGQLVEAYKSISQGTTSVNLQTFNVLPVPIEDSVGFSNLVMLDDCFARFCNVENLSEIPETLDVRSEQSTASSSNQLRNIPGRGLAGHTHFQLAQGSEMTCLPSPIHPSVASQVVPSSPHLQPLLRENDSGFLDNTFRTSTPLRRDLSVTKAPNKNQRRCLLRQLPECLIVQLMRFRYDNVANAPFKVRTSVSIRLRDFNLKDLIYDSVVHRSDMTAASVGYIYELYGLCIHLGAESTSHGHYVSYCLDKGRWFRMDDHNVVEVNMEYQLNTEEIRQNAYILFYRRSTPGHV